MTVNSIINPLFKYIRNIKIRLFQRELDHLIDFLWDWKYLVKEEKNRDLIEQIVFLLQDLQHNTEKEIE